LLTLCPGSAWAIGIGVGVGRRSTDPAVTGASGRGAVRPIQAQDVVLDTSPARQVLSLWKRTPRRG